MYIKVIASTVICIWAVFISSCSIFMANRGEQDFTASEELFNKGREALNREDYVNAILFFKELVSLDQGKSSAHLWLGKAFLDRGGDGDMKTAITEFKTAMIKSKDSERDIRQIREFLFARANKYSRQEDRYNESRCYLAYTENFNSQDIDAYLALANIFTEMGNPMGALYYAKKAYTLAPNNKEVRELMSDLNTPMQH